MRARNLKTVCLALLAAALFCTWASAVMTDYYYSGELDPESGLPLSGEWQEAAAESRTVVWITEDMYYDRLEGLFAYPTGSGTSEVRASVANGMIVTEPVRIFADSSVPVVLYRNGAEVDGADLTYISQVGKYTLSAKGADAMRSLFSFTILGQTTNLSGGYRMPDGFYIIHALLDEEEAYYEPSFIPMEEEGRYSVEYYCSATELHYTLETIIDRTPPQVTLDGKIDKKGRYHSAVQIGGLQDGDSVTITRDNNAIAFPQDWRLTEAGVYQIEFFDAAGNSVTKQFTILVYFDMNSLIFMGLIALILLGICAYIFYRRTRLKTY